MKTTLKEIKRLIKETMNDDDLAIIVKTESGREVPKVIGCDMTSGSVLCQMDDGTFVTCCREDGEWVIESTFGAMTQDDIDAMESI